jgi:hypothetical protein
MGNANQRYKSSPKKKGGLAEFLKSTPKKCCQPIESCMKSRPIEFCTPCLPEDKKQKKRKRTKTPEFILKAGQSSIEEQDYTRTFNPMRTPYTQTNRNRHSEPPPFPSGLKNRYGNAPIEEGPRAEYSLPPSNRNYHQYYTPSSTDKTFSPFAEPKIAHKTPSRKFFRTNQCYTPAELQAETKFRYYQRQLDQNYNYNYPQKVSFP